jgi:hypothetical protein
MYVVQVTDNATPALENLERDLHSPLMAALGKRAEVELRDHFADRNAEPNKMGWPSQNFWDRIRKATALLTWDDVSASIAIGDPAINQKVYGGTITAKRCASLAIPASAEAYAAGSPREGATPALRFAFAYDSQRSCWRPALVAAEDYQRQIRSGKRKGEVVRTKNVRQADQVAATGPGRATTGAGTVWYWLCKSVTQAPDPRALPDEGVMFDAMIDQTRKFLARHAA